MRLLQNASSIIFLIPLSFAFQCYNRPRVAVLSLRNALLSPAAEVEVSDSETTTIRYSKAWTKRLEELSDFSRTHGHCRVPKRYAANPQLGNWVNKQRQMYRKYQNRQTPCSLTQERIDRLNSIGFCWNATLAAKQTTITTEDDNDVEASLSSFYKKREANWQKSFLQLKDFVAENQKDSTSSSGMHGSLVDNCPLTLTTWLRRQRRDADRLDRWQVRALESLDPNWRLKSRDARYEIRFRELLEFRNRHGHVCVPISYENRQLAHWVSNQRKAYKLWMQGRPSSLTEERRIRLESIGFVWDRWEFEFSRKEAVHGDGDDDNDNDKDSNS